MREGAREARNATSARAKIIARLQSAAGYLQYLRLKLHGIVDNPGGLKSKNLRFQMIANALWGAAAGRITNCPGLIRYGSTYP